MQVNINLATQPYEDARRYLTRWGSIVALLLIATLGLVAFTVHLVRRSSDINRQLAAVDQKLSTLDREKAEAERMLALPQNRGTVDKSEYLNSIFARKAFSWTRVFSDMEKLMPPGLHVVSIAPQLDKDNQLQVHILVGGESRDRALTLVRNLEKTPSFRDVLLRSDVTNTSQTERGTTTTGPEEEKDLIRFDIVARYVPPEEETGATEAKAAPKNGAQTVAQSGGRP